LATSPVRDIYQLLSRIPIINIKTDASFSKTIEIRGYSPEVSHISNQTVGEAPSLPTGAYDPREPLLLIDNTAMDLSVLDMINPNDIGRIDVLRRAEAAIYGIRAGRGVISILSKDGSSIKNMKSPSSHMKTISPLGYQQPIEFYAPKYETQAQRNNPKPDLRTTIHWQPVVHTNEHGMALFEFYSADEQTSYTVVIEGLADNGTIIRREQKLWRRE
jgi:hypothetical protein